MIREILIAFGSINAAARKMNLPYPTVYFWVKNANIPYWRRAAVLREAGRHRIKLTPEQRTFLSSKERAPNAHSATTSPNAYA